MDIDHLQHRFTYLLLDASTRSRMRTTSTTWQPSLFAEGAIVRSYGRKDGSRRTLSPLPYTSLPEAWPVIRALIRRRLRHGYKIIESKEIVEIL
jgi:hypothetical protein